MKDAFLPVPQEKPLNVNLGGGEFLVKRNLPGQRVGAKPWFDLFTEYLTEELNYKFSTPCPCLGKNEKSIILIHADDLVFTGCSKYISEIFLPKTQDRLDTSVSKIEKVDDEFNFKLEKDGLWIQPGYYIQQMLKAYEEQIGKAKIHYQTPSDNSIQMGHTSEVLHEEEKISLFRSIVGSGI